MNFLLHTREINGPENRRCMRSSSEQLLFRSWVSGLGPMRGSQWTSLNRFYGGGAGEARPRLCSIRWIVAVFAPSRFSHFHCNAMKKAIKAHKNLHQTSTPQGTDWIYFRVAGMWALIMSRVTKGFRFFNFLAINGNAFEFKLNSCI